MKKVLLFFSASVLLLSGIYLSTNKFFVFDSKTIEGRVGEVGEENEEENEGYDGAAARTQWEFERIKDPATGTVPFDQLMEAIQYTDKAKISLARNLKTQSTLLWQERGPIYDSVGPSNGNGRGGGTGFTGAYTAGRIRAVVRDASDATGNTVWCGSVAGGLWKCTNFLSADPNWTPVNENFDNLAISSICQDPSNPDVMYFSTGEASANADAVLGKGVWKSTDHGLTWNLLSSTASVNRIFKVVCDAAGNIYYASRGAGLQRSKDGGASFVNITPSGQPSTCTDFEISSTGKLHAAFGYNIGNGTAAYRYTTDPAIASASAGWNEGTGFPTASNTAVRIELTTAGEIVYAITTNNSNNVYATWQSTDGGANWTKKNSTDYPSGVSNTQGWYNITLEVDPANSSRIIMGGLDLYRSSDAGATISRVSNWVTNSPYVHADQHNTIWYTSGSESRLIVASDGGLFYSNDGGTNWSDKNKNLAIKQFYSCATSAESGSNYFLAGAQDNGVHQLKNAGKSYSFEVTGGDGGFVDISQTNPNIQFGSYVYNLYRRSTDGGKTWSKVEFSGSVGQFINPFDYDEQTNAVFACYGTDALLRWNSASSGSTSTTLTVTGLGNSSAVTVSPYTSGTVYAGSTSGKVFKITNADKASITATNISDAAFPGGVVNCINVGTTDNNLVVVFSNYGVNNVWYTTNGGSSWSQVDGNLPNMPVRWAVFPPGANDRLVIATEAGIYTSGIINGSSTVWTPSLGFPTVRTNMLKVRASDNTIIAATHGRGLWTANIAQVLPLRNLVLKGQLENNGNALLSWATNASPKTKFHIQFSIDGINYSTIATVPYNMAEYKHNMPVATGYYRILAEEPNSAPVISNVILLQKRNVQLSITVAPNPVSSHAAFLVSGSQNITFHWEICTVTGQVVQKGSGRMQSNTTAAIPVHLAPLPSGMYWFRVVQGGNTISTSFVKQ